MTPAALRDLLRLMDARKARDLARLDRLLTEDRRLAEDIAALAATASRDRAEGPLAARRAGPPPRLAAARIRAAERRRAPARRRIRAARAEAVQSLGKHKALEHLTDRADRAAAHQRAGPRRARGAAAAEAARLTRARARAPGLRE